ncbi:MAG: 5-(carboxyamino)imidazole ribonucleotide synthase [Saprospiraceae bacterium]
MIDKKIGILGGGQLGKMLCMAATGMNLDIRIMDESIEFPAGLVNKNFIEGDITKYEDVLRFGRTVDILTIEFEKINVDALSTLEKEGIQVYPSAHIIAVIQDKGIQKEFFVKNNISTSNFISFNNKSEIIEAIISGKVSYPFVQKTKRDGYDGQGVLICKDLSCESQMFDLPSIVEDIVDIDKEIAVIACRNANGDIVIYDAVEMVFDSEANLLDYQLSPAQLDKDVRFKVSEMAYEIAIKLDLVGILAIEFFLTKKGEVIVNEMAPRPHNSGHHTIEACDTSQYENHLRAILNLPLGCPDIISSSILVNLMGSNNFVGDTSYSGLIDILKISGAHLHLYGKKHTKPFRKMGHVTLLHEKEHIPINAVEVIKQAFRTAPVKIKIRSNERE